MASPKYFLDVTRALFQCAADPQGGQLMPPGFQNPFTERRRTTDATQPDLFGEPDITVDMAAEFLVKCEERLLPLFSLYIPYGLRASEPCWLFWDSLEAEWLKVACDPQLGYVTKGRRDKRLPLIEPIRMLSKTGEDSAGNGLLFRRSAVLKDHTPSKLEGVSRDDLRQEYAARWQRDSPPSAKRQHEIRDQPTG